SKDPQSTQSAPTEKHAAKKEAASNGGAASQAAAKDNEDDGNVVRPREDMLKRFEIGQAAKMAIERVQEIPGRIEVDEKRVTRIGASVTGRVVEIAVDVGSRVRAGEVLARISSTELTQAQLNFLRANAAFSLAERALERAQQLFKADVISAAELQRRESEQSIARAEMRAASDHLSLLGIDHTMQKRLRELGQLDPTVGVIATRGGVIVERKVSQGQVAQPGDALFTVADLSTVWAVGALPEQAAASVYLGQVVDLQVLALGDKRFRGRIVFVSDTIQPDTRTITVRTEVDNASRELKPQMFATMRLFGDREERLAIPDSAVVRESDRDYVFLHQPDGGFRMIPVEVGASINGKRPVIRGLSEGQAIVMRGAFHLNNERKRAELE
ncbi:MAG: efflux RND transporter periplasmic adaptor subunit, partial [Betaproteobacteria bacterium]|nr:efflux RND transporter periplasmic adaptor subunit [Betaproteobacteria bacterium]